MMTHRLKEAEAEFRRNIQLDRKNVQTHLNLGNLLQMTKRLKEAEATYRRAIEIDPEYFGAYFNLGNLLRITNRPKEAEAAYRRAIEIDPKHATALGNLGIVLMMTDRPKEAEAAFRRATRIDPKDASTHFNLGVMLLKTNRFADALKSLLSARALMNTASRWRVDRVIALTKQYLAMEKKLAAITSGRARTQNSLEALRLADFALVRRHQPRIAARLFRKALADRTLPRQLRFRFEYNAACAAVLCAAGRVEKGADAPDAEESKRLRKDALEWLEANLATWKRLMRFDARYRAFGMTQLRHWLIDSDVAYVRDNAIDRLPADERTAWRKLWADVRTVIRSYPVMAPRPRQRSTLFAPAAASPDKRRSDRRRPRRHGSAPTHQTTRRNSEAIETPRPGKAVVCETQPYPEAI
jgi:Flp pilus assembly protein TadD